MSLDLSKFTNITDPIAKIVKDTGSTLIDTAENAVIGNLSAAFARLGLGSGSNKSVLGNLGEQVLAGIAGEIFGAIGRELNISSKSDIEDYRGVILEGDMRRDDIEAENLTTIGKGAKQPVLVYPSDLNDFYIQLDFKKYKRPAPSVLAEVATEFSIALPLPRNLSDTHSISYDNRLEMGVIGAIFNQGQANVNKEPVDALVDNAAYAAAYLGKDGIRQLTGGTGEAFVSLISQNFGATLNPHLAVMFQAPRLREHKMQWMLAPNNPAESETIRRITQLIRGAALPAFIRNQQGSANLNLLEMPMMCKMTLYPWGDKSKFAALSKDPKDVYNENMYTFKHCVIDGISINYAPSNLAFFENDGNAPAFLLLEMSFLEIEYYTADDFGRQGKQLDVGKTLSDTWNNDILGTLTGDNLDPNAVGAINTDQTVPGAQNADTNNFALQGNSNETIVEEYPADTNDSSSQSFLHKTADGSWYQTTYTPYGETIVEPITNLTSPSFDHYNVPGENRNVIPLPSAPPITTTDGKAKAMLSTTDGNIVIKVGDA